MYFINSINNLKACSPKCKTCIATPSKCLTCDETNKRVYDNMNSKCVCDYNYYDNGAAMCASKLKYKIY